MLATERALKPVHVALFWSKCIVEEIAVVAPARFVARIAIDPCKLAPELMELVRAIVQHCSTRG